MALAMSNAVRNTAGNDQRNLIPYAFFHEKIVDLGNCVLNGHGNIFLRHVRRRSGAAVRTVQMNYVSTGVIRAYCNHVHIRRR